MVCGAKYNNYVPPVLCDSFQVVWHGENQQVSTENLTTMQIKGSPERPILNALFQKIEMCCHLLSCITFLFADYTVFTLNKQPSVKAELLL